MIVASPALLEVSGVDLAYGTFQVGWDISLDVRQGEIVALMGPNGSGKSTVLNAIGGLVRPLKGSITFGGSSIDVVPAFRRTDLGISLVLERHRLFPGLTVRENLLLGAFRGEAKRRRSETLRRVEQIFPLIGSRSGQRARTLSGGEQQMVAIARGLMSRPKLLMVDEPTLGLTPKLAADVVSLLGRLNQEDGLSILFVEQDVEVALALAHRGYVLESGRVAVHGHARELLGSPTVKRVFMGEVGRV